MVFVILAITNARHAQSIPIALLAIVAIIIPQVGAILLVNRDVKHAILIRRALSATMAIISKAINVLNVLSILKVARTQVVTIIR